jgi:hypothetical protein
MAATTITRTGVTLTNDTGTAASPAGDGTLLNNAWVQTFLDRIDSLVSGNITFGGTITAEGFGTHALTAGGTGSQLLRVRNTTAGTGNYAGVTIGTDNDNAVVLRANSSTYTTSAPYTQNAATLISTVAGGLDISANHASGAMRFYTGGTTEVARIGAADKCLQLGFGLWLKGSYDQTITGTQTLDSGGQYYAVIRLTSCASTPKISSCTAGNDGDIKILVNVSGASCTVQHNGGAPTTRIYLANATDGTIADDESLMLMYDAGSSSWIEIGPR